jgi:ubiquitin thioesterase protein OTUB1
MENNQQNQNNNDSNINNINNNNNESNKENQNNQNNSIKNEYYDENGKLKFEEIIKYENQLREEIEKTTPLISELKPINELYQEFQNSEFMNIIPLITNKYSNIRLIRRDGNCFYRCFIYRLFEEIAINKDENLYKSLKNIINNSKDITERNGYEWIVVEDFYQEFINNLTICYETEKNQCRQLLDILFNNKEKSNYLIVFVRLFIAAFLKENKILYESFIFDIPFETWVNREVEAVDNECDQIQIMAIVNAFNIGVIIENLNQKSLDTMKFPEDGNNIFIHVLFRPGHYDILYPKEI